MFKVYTENDYYFKDENGKEYISSPENSFFIETIVINLGFPMFMVFICLLNGGF